MFIHEILLRRNPTTHTRLQGLHPATAQARTVRHQKNQVKQKEYRSTCVGKYWKTVHGVKDRRQGSHKVSGPRCTKRVNLALKQWQRGIKEKKSFQWSLKAEDPIHTNALDVAIHLRSQVWLLETLKNSNLHNTMMHQIAFAFFESPFYSTASKRKIPP